MDVLSSGGCSDGSGGGSGSDGGDGIRPADRHFLVRMKIMNVAVFVMLYLVCRCDVERYVLLVLIVPGGTKQS